MQPAFLVYLAALVGALLMAIKRWRTGDLIPVADTVLLTSPFVAASFTAKSWHTRRWRGHIGSAGSRR